VGEYELFTLGLAIAIVMIVGRSVASRLEIPEAIVLVVLGVLARKRVTEAGLTRLDQLAEAGEVDEDTPV